MAQGEERRGNPFNLLICDTDALIQVFCSHQGALLRSLKRVYGIQCLITEAVEDELNNPRQRHAGLIDPALQKVIANESLIVITQQNIGRFTSNDRNTTYDTIQLKGQDYHGVVQRGEAYTHAAAVVLRAAALSNDRKAVATLDRARKQLPFLYIRTYDIFVLFHQRTELPAKECDVIRKSLTQVDDHPHSAFESCKFIEGLERFYPRLVDESYAIVGSATTRELGDENRVTIRAVEATSH